MNEIEQFLKNIAILKWGSVKNSGFRLIKDCFRFKCPYCGDSKKNKNKKRFNYDIKRNIFHCFNCDKAGNLQNLVEDFNVSGSEEIKKHFNQVKVVNFLSKEKNVVSEDEKEYELIYPNGCLLSEVLKGDEYKKLGREDKKLLLDVLYFLNSRKVKREWYRYFYFIFNGDKFQNYILTLFLYNNEWVWSGRKIKNEIYGPKYIHLSNFPFSKIVSFENEVSPLKGKKLYICESFFSSLVLNQEGFNSVSVFGVHNMKFDHLPLDKFRKDFNLIWIPDNDDTFSIFYKNNIDFKKEIKILMPPDKDISDSCVRLNGLFKKEFIKLKVITLFDYTIKNKISKFI